MFKLSMNNNDGIINECARAQVEAKKKNKKLQEEIEIKDKIIEHMKYEYQTQMSNINEKFTQILQDNENEIQSLKNDLNNRSKRIMAIQQTSRDAMNARTDLEVFFIEQLQECKIEIAKKKKMEEDRRKNVFPFLNMSVSSQFNNNSGSTDDDSFFITSAKKVEIKDIEPEYKEKLLRNLLNKLNEQTNKKGIVLRKNK
jgi:predicted phage tail protein